MKEGFSPLYGSHWRVSIPRPADYKSAALPAELQWQHSEPDYVASGSPT